MSASDVNKLLLVPGIVISATRTRPKAERISVQCSKCSHREELLCPAGMGSVTIPRKCGNVGQSTEPCPVDPYVVMTDDSKYVDQQTLKLQEAPETIPTSEMPRHVTVSVENSLANHITPGTRVSIIGISLVAQFGPDKSRAAQGAIKTPYIRAVGVIIEEEGAGRAVTSFTPEDEAEFLSLSRSSNLYQRLASSVAPSITGDYTSDLKRAILCLLFAGSRKLLPDGMRLRGDINVLMIGDPSMAKSQFLKFVEKVAPVGVYTSGKGSSAAGLTASIIRGKNGEFSLEGGAMVIADGGVVCIDEFDKMREEDRVAIHEAMEQQTISIAKAGITTILNSRTAVLAASNPVFGRYDDSKSAGENIDLLPTILSRFDLIFIVRDIRDEGRDMAMARNIMRIHVEAGSLDTNQGSDTSNMFADSRPETRQSISENADSEIDLATMKRYIAYARSKCAPRLTNEAAQMLASEYVSIRQTAKLNDLTAKTSGMSATEAHGVIPITVRQFEALIRITESLAKMTLSREATSVHVEEAIRLFRVSTLSAAASGITSLETGMSLQQLERVKAVESRLLRLVPVGSTMPTNKVREHLMTRGKFSEAEVNAAISILERREEVSLLNERRNLRRLR
jgi:DNA replication licensing factor MCM5